jgi:hypothetical protein
MSTEEKLNEANDGDVHADENSGVDGDNSSKEGDGAGGAITLFFIFGLVASLVIGWVVFPKLLYS